MAHTTTQVESTVQIGGNLIMRVVDVDITNYDDGNDGNGETLTPQELGLARRFVTGHAEVIGAGSASSGKEGVTAQFRVNSDPAELRLYEEAGSAGELAEVSADADEGSKVRLTVIGV